MEVEDHSKRELVRLVKSMEARNAGQRLRDFENLPVKLMVKTTCRRILHALLSRIGIK